MPGSERSLPVLFGSRQIAAETEKSERKEYPQNNHYQAPCRPLRLGLVSPLHRDDPPSPAVGAAAHQLVGVWATSGGSQPPYCGVHMNLDVIQRLQLGQRGSSCQLGVTVKPGGETNSGLADDPYTVTLDVSEFKPTAVNVAPMLLGYDEWVVLIGHRTFPEPEPGCSPPVRVGLVWAWPKPPEPAVALVHGELHPNAGQVKPVLWGDDFGRNLDPPIGVMHNFLVVAGRSIALVKIKLVESPRQPLWTNAGGRCRPPLGNAVVVGRGPPQGRLDLFG